MQSSNSLAPRTPYRVPLNETSGAPDLAPSDVLQVPLILHASQVAEQDLCLLFVFREVSTAFFPYTFRSYFTHFIDHVQSEGKPFHSARVIWRYEVVPIMRISAEAEPSHSPDHLFILNAEIENVSMSNSVLLTQITTMSANWGCTPLSDNVGYVWITIARC